MVRLIFFFIFALDVLANDCEQELHERYSFHYYQGLCAAETTLHSTLACLSRKRDSLRKDLMENVKDNKCQLLSRQSEQDLNEDGIDKILDKAYTHLASLCPIKFVFAGVKSHKNCKTKRKSTHSYSTCMKLAINQIIGANEFSQCHSERMGPVDWFNINKMVQKKK